MTGHVVRDLPAALGFAAVVAAVAAHPPAVLSRAPLRGLGTISYGLYLWHLPVLLWLRFEGLMPGGFVLPWLEVAALSALVAYASWVLVERPAIEAAGRWRPWTRRVPSFPAERTSSRCRAWREARDDGLRLVDEVVVGEAHDAVAGGREGRVLAAVALEGGLRRVGLPATSALKHRLELAAGQLGLLGGRPREGSLPSVPVVSLGVACCRSTGVCAALRRG